MDPEVYSLAPDTCSYYHGAACYQLLLCHDGLTDCMPSNNKAKLFPPLLGCLLLSLNLVTAMQKVNYIVGLGYYNLCMLPYIIGLDVMITRFMAR